MILFKLQRHFVFEWVIVVLGSYTVCSGTLLRALQIKGVLHGADWHTSPDQVQTYFHESLTAWVGCVILDGRTTFNIIRVYSRRRLACLRGRRTGTQVLELAGVLVSLISMVKFSLDVYNNFKGLTDDLSIYFWFMAAVAFKIIRIFVKGETPIRIFQRGLTSE